VVILVVMLAGLGLYVAALKGLLPCLPGGGSGSASAASGNWGSNPIYTSAATPVVVWGGEMPKAIVQQAGQQPLPGAVNM
jgi:hypothetical protein